MGVSPCFWTQIGSLFLHLNEEFHQKLIVMSKATLIFYPNLYKVEKRSKKIPIYLRIIFKGRKAESRLNVLLNENELACWDPILMRVGLKDSKQNKILNTYQAIFDEYLFKNAVIISSQQAIDIRDSILGKSPKRSISGLLEYVNRYYNSEVLLKRELAVGTKKNYKKAIKHLQNFLKVEGIEQVLLSEIDNSFANRFKNYLLNDNLMEHRVGMTEPSALGIIKKFRTIYKYAMLEGLISRNPFKEIVLKKKSPRKPKLNINQVRTIFKASFLFSESLTVCKDIFLFSVFTGLAYKDCFDLTQNNISKYIDGSIKLSIDRAKSGVLTELFLVNQAIDIINKYSDHHEIKVKGGVLPKRSNKTLNANLKIISERLDLGVNLSSHIGRHSNRQLLFDAEINNAGVIKRMLGHSNAREMDSLYYEVTESGLIAAKRKFQLYLDENLIHHSYDLIQTNSKH